jgi:hypothetical protein
MGSIIAQSAPQIKCFIALSIPKRVCMEKIIFFTTFFVIDCEWEMSLNHSQLRVNVACVYHQIIIIYFNGNRHFLQARAGKTKNRLDPMPMRHRRSERSC